MRPFGRCSFTEPEGARRQGKAGEGERERKHGQAESLGGGKGTEGQEGRGTFLQTRNFEIFFVVRVKITPHNLITFIIEKVVKFFDDIFDFLVLFPG